MEMRNEGDMAGGEVKEQIRKKRQGKEKVEKEKVQWHGKCNFAIFSSL